MSDRPCIRCQHPVLLEDGHLTYCSYCGAPQIFLSEELQEEIADQARAFADRNTPRPTPEEGAESTSTGRRFSGSRALDSAQQPWSRAVQYALVSAGVALALGLLTLVFPPLVLLMLFWVVVAPIAAVTLYNARALRPVPEPLGFSAKLGLLTGILVTFSCAAVAALGLTLARFAFHATASLDAELAANFAQQKILVLQRLGTTAQPALDMYAVPEFRVGLMLCAAAMGGAIYLFTSTLAAGLAGAVLGRRRSI